MATPEEMSQTGQRMRLVTFYLDEPTRLAVEQRLSVITPDAIKGSMGALLRVLLREFCALPFDDTSLDTLQKKIEAEYVYTTKKNKRSKL